MTTISSISNRLPPLMPLPMPSYAYQYPNSDSQPFSSLPDRVGIYNTELPGVYKWETRFLEKNLKSTYIGPTEFKELPKHYALSSNWPKENYSPLFTNTDKPIAAKGYIPHFTNKTHTAWRKFLDVTQERYELEKVNDFQKMNFEAKNGVDHFRTVNLDSSETVKTGIGADFTERPTIALSSQYRNNDGYRHSSMYNINNWIPYGNPKAYFNSYITGAPKFS